MASVLPLPAADQMDDAGEVPAALAPGRARVGWTTPRKPAPPSPQALCSASICGAAAPSGVVAPAALAASCASLRSLSMSAEAKPGLYLLLEGAFGTGP